MDLYTFMYISTSIWVSLLPTKKCNLNDESTTNVNFSDTRFAVLNWSTSKFDSVWNLRYFVESVVASNQLPLMVMRLWSSVSKPCLGSSVDPGRAVVNSDRVEVGDSGGAVGNSDKEAVGDWGRAGDSVKEAVGDCKWFK